MKTGRAGGGVPCFELARASRGIASNSTAVATDICFNGKPGYSDGGGGGCQTLRLVESAGDGERFDREIVGDIIAF